MKIWSKRSFRLSYCSFIILVPKRKQIIVGIDPGDFVITTSDLSEGAALEIAADKGTWCPGSFAQGIAEAVSAQDIIIKI